LGHSYFINGIRKIKYHAVIGIGCNRKLVNGCPVKMSAPSRKTS